MTADEPQAQWQPELVRLDGDPTVEVCRWTLDIADQIPHTWLSPWRAGAQALTTEALALGWQCTIIDEHLGVLDEPAAGKDPAATEHINFGAGVDVVTEYGPIEATLNTLYAECRRRYQDFRAGDVRREDLQPVLVCYSGAHAVEATSILASLLRIGRPGRIHLAIDLEVRDRANQESRDNVGGLYQP